MQTVQDNKLILLLCENCQAMKTKMLADVLVRYSENLSVQPVPCPAQIDPFSIIKLLRNSNTGVLVTCNHESCCQRENRTLLKRWEMLKDILPVFGYHRDLLQFVSIKPSCSDNLVGHIDKMLTFINTTSHSNSQGDFLDKQTICVDSYKWIN